MNTIQDIVAAPLNAAEVTLAIILAACTRSFLITLLSVVIFSFLIDFKIYSFSLLIVYTFLGSFILGSVGFVAGLYANKFDQMSGIQTFIIVVSSIKGLSSDYDLGVKSCINHKIQECIVE